MAAQNQQQSQSDNSLSFLWILVGITVLTLFIWYFLSAQIITGVLYVRLFEVKLISIFAGSVNEVAVWIRSQNPADLTFTQVLTLSTIVGEYLRYALTPLLAVLGIILFFTSNANRFKTVFNADRFVKTESKNWPHIAPIADLNLVDQHVDKGEWAMAMTPMMFAKKHKLLIVEKEAPNENSLSRDLKTNISVDRGLTNAIFAAQVGTPWQSPEALKSHERALFAIFAARAGGNIEKSRHMLEQISSSAHEHGKLNFNGIDELFAKHKNNKKVKRIIDEHAFVLTVMASLLELARKDGVLSSSEFLWLKPVDRSLWYMLNTVGRQTAVSEAAGPYAHWLAEKRVGHRINSPMIAEATQALNEAVKEFVYHDDLEDK